MDYLWEWPDLAAEVGGLLEVEPDDALWPGDDTPPALPQHLHQHTHVALCTPLCRNDCLDSLNNTMCPVQGSRGS